MLLTQEKSRCKKNQSIVVSKDKGNAREHRAINPDRKFDLRQYKLDGDLFQHTTCCDFLLVNDSNKNAYLIELKGTNIDDAIGQLEAGEEKTKADLVGYTFFYRIVCSKATTLKLQDLQIRKFKDKHGDKFMIKQNILEEVLD